MNLKPSDFAARNQMDNLSPDWHFGTLREVIQRGDYCVFCKLIANSVSTDAFSREVEVLGCWVPDVVFEEFDPLTQAVTTMTTLRLRIAPEMVGWEDAFDPFDIVPMAVNGQDNMFQGRTVDESFIDIDLLRAWLQTCQDSHHVVCWPQNPESHNRRWQDADVEPFIRLLDLETNCLIETSTPPEFVALSYVWGTVEVFTLGMDNYLNLMKPGSLTEYEGKFPKTIQDAMKLTKLLGYRYLWTDSICIIQRGDEDERGDDDDKAVQLRLMDVVYSRASVTVTAASGTDANVRLAGVCGVSRSKIQNTARYSDDLLLLALMPDFEDGVQQMYWNSRGWTYQERLLSRRLLVFTRDTVYFQCGQMTCTEDFNMLKPGVIQSASQQDIMLSRGEEPPTLTPRSQYRLGISEEYYYRMVTEYTSRHMSHADDRVNGFEGILNVLRNVYGDVFIWGMWTGDMLLQSLLWQPRQELRRVYRWNTTTPVYPTWAWAGWTGAVRFDDPGDWNGFPSLDEPSDRVRPSSLGACAEINEDDTPGCHLRVRTRTGKFKLTFHDKSGALRPPALPEVDGPHPVRFGITGVVQAEGGDPEPWLGSILMPQDHRQRLSDEYEFALLSDAYCFSSEELSTSAPRFMSPWEVVNVMLIHRQDKLSLNGVPVVERGGVGRMLKSAWDKLSQECEEILVA
ncbi:hypothetical protein CGCF415_v004313 [Colletotrichum fructicola]|uniref:Heterokaryon incompatibility domain-containing protein n=1 Tax=Colletotrichum fructicola (strain Nara gc5) TaxID=1213859 RepID=L2GAX7_COLFN|nr:uncharacterized protein CGMCC3_g2314 [Colletotrichum fructicola]KAE9581855.1 hypothetical protein CGMCC3_g2314 [Colletotrichum fructicola]KAF4891218.1 hypothetical protein CGCFRS4_v008324 [Colletotrichum fructicola]KAF4893827.1 hypothetical protein CGCF415_v012494 [Colletotrichum fructicola]KAF4911655.1 hypothetical protein CGCF415_v004313 [Colletotrichum fructicola]KAF4941987.1 hypothetical protein CGCF245_v001056 [Colletotrichum fructicola]